MNLLPMIEGMEAAGLSPEQILLAIKKMEGQRLDRQRSGARTRKQRQRENDKQQVTDVTPVTDVTRDTSPPLNPPLLSSPHPFIQPPLISPPHPAVDVLRVREIFDWIEKFFDSPAPLFSAPITAWLEWGADFDLDIQPVCERWKKKSPTKPMRSLGWLDDDIAKSLAQRRKPMPDVDEVKENSHSPPRNFETFDEIKDRKHAELMKKMDKKYANPAGLPEGQPLHN